jgi:hypothetical protein
MNMKETIMEPEKTLHVSLPQVFVAQMEKTAEDATITLDELVRQAVQRYISNESWNGLYAYGEGQAYKLGIKEEDVDRIIHEFREEERDRESKERGH